MWRIDWQVPPETDADHERTTGGLERRIRAVIGPDTPFELSWLTAYRFSQRLADRFGAGRCFLAGDAAHLMSPFGARGLNSGVADAENLAWKLAWVLRGEAPQTLLDSYEAERRPVAAENLRVTDATMRFMAPRGPLRGAWRDLVLRMAPRSAWFRSRVDSGRLAEPATYAIEGGRPPTRCGPGLSRRMCRSPAAAGCGIGWGAGSWRLSRARLEPARASRSSRLAPRRSTGRIGRGSSVRTVIWR